MCFTFHKTFLKKYKLLGLISLECKRVMFTETIHTVWSVNDGTARDLLKNTMWQVSGKTDKSMVFQQVFSLEIPLILVFFLFGCYIIDGPRGTFHQIVRIPLLTCDLLCLWSVCLSFVCKTLIQNYFCCIKMYLIW